MTARIRCDTRCGRSVGNAARALTRLVVHDLGWWWLAGILGTAAIAGAAWWWWDYIREWLRQVG